QEAASAAAVALSEGVCRTMQLAKFKLIAVFVLAATLVGGAGLLAGRGPSPTTADEPPKQRTAGPVAKQKPGTTKPAAPPTKPVDSWRGQTAVWPPPGNTWQVDWTQDLQEAKRLEIELDEHEQVWGDEIAKARRELLVQQEQLRLLEQREQEQSRRGQAAEERAEKHAEDARRQLESLTAAWADAPRITAVTPEQVKKRLANAQDNLEKARKERANIQAENDTMHQRTQGQRINARLAVMEAQDRLDRLERRQARKRDQIQGDLELIQERIRRARWGFPPIGAGQDDRLERKVDQLRQQIEDLRRDLRNRTGNTATKP
ncbi:MAG TPA: hypothetical protein VFA18_15660, partial [Gemmataceae bacterium]|nr:hypothetical protein [Gemmataceae bacterium]